MSRIIDISVPLAAGICQWPGDPLFEAWLDASIAAGAEADVTAMRLCAHTGTHVDAPSHYFASAASMDDVPSDALIGPAEVVQVEGAAVTADDVRRASQPRVLFRTRNSEADWWREPYRPDAVELTAEAAHALADRGALAVGIDYLSIGSAEVHRVLLTRRIAILEGLCLSFAPPGPYELICLPLKVAGAEGAPARAVLREG